MHDIREQIKAATGLDFTVGCGRTQTSDSVASASRHHSSQQNAAVLENLTTYSLLQIIEDVLLGTPRSLPSACVRPATTASTSSTASANHVWSSDKSRQPPSIPIEALFHSVRTKVLNPETRHRREQRKALLDLMQEFVTGRQNDLIQAWRKARNDKQNEWRQQLAVVR